MNQSITDTINTSNLPQHVAIIMDGNGRWAKQQGFDRTFGHQNALKAVRSAIETCGDLSIPYLTLFAFSTENWNRPKLEVNFLMKLLAQTIQSEIKELNSKGIRLKVIGELDSLPSSVQEPLKKAIKLTEENRKATLVIALNYGSQHEILQATKKIAEEVKKGMLEISAINEKLFENYLYTHDMPNVDLLIRTSGEHRISNFLLWQIAYAELYFTEVLWPDFNEEEFYKAILNYQNRERRFGKISEQLTN